MSIVNKRPERLMELEEIVTSCPLCECLSFVRTHEPDLCRCSSCSLYFRNPRPTQETILESYNDGIAFNQWQQELAIRGRHWRKRLRLILSYKTSGRLLDVGTGDGFFLGIAAEYFEVEATEIAKIGVAFAAERGHSVHLGTIFDTDWGTTQFDVITLWHVLEHLPCPGETLRKLRSLLKPDGIFVLAVPNETVPLLRGRFAAKKIHPFSLQTWGSDIHLLHFTPAVMRATMHRFGFDPIHFGVDDVHIHRRFLNLPKYYACLLFNRLFGTHWDTAMFLICSVSRQ